MKDHILTAEIYEIEKRAGVSLPKEILSLLLQDSNQTSERIQELRDFIQNLICTHPSKNIEISGNQIKAVASNIRKADLDWSNLKLSDGELASEGDLAMAEVCKDSGSTIKIENIFGRDVRIYKGDKVIVIFGNRHSGTSEYGGIPPEGWDIHKKPVVDLLCHGGIVGEAKSIPSRMGASPTQLEIMGFLYSGQKKINLRDIFPVWDSELKPSAPFIVSCGTGAEIGKTTTATSIIRALKGRRLKVAATKLAGTGRLRDLLALKDAGADICFDFPDVGLPSTYTSADRYIPAIRTLINKLNQGNPDIIVAEFGGDIIEANIPTFFNTSEFKKLVQVVIHSSGDVMGMKGSLSYYEKWGLNKPVHLTYPIGKNILGAEERVREQIGLSLFNPLSTDHTDLLTSTILSQICLDKIV